MRKCSTLMSLSFNSEDVIAEKVYAAFSPYTSTRVGGEDVLNYFMDVFMAACDGCINFDTFNLIGYIKSIQKNEVAKTAEKAKKNKHFKPCFAEDVNDEDSVSEEKIADERDDYEKIIDSYEVRWAIKRLESIKSEMIVGFQVNIISTIKKALLGYPQAVKQLTELCDEIDEISSIIHILLESGENVTELLDLVS